MLVGFATGLTRFILNFMAGDQCEPWSALHARSDWDWDLPTMT